MRTYIVWLKGVAKPIEVQADDVETESGGDESKVWWNFTINETDDATVTVAAFPCASVEYIESKASQ